MTDPLLSRRVFALVVLISAYLLFVPSDGVPGSSVPHADKLVHATIFATLAATGLLAALPVRALVPGLIAYAVGSEVTQSLLPFDRAGDPWDAVADLVGIQAGASLARRLARRLLLARPPRVGT